MDRKTFKELWENDELEEVFSEADPSWRHGCYMTVVYEDSKGYFWQASFQRSGDGEYHGIREDEFELCEVEPVVVSKTEYQVKSNG